ncbi:RsmB/NOP family class I SAM-dependent RNA methyltransferase [Pseudaminobacter sp. 19-2017]|uniref:RsmB/NOP family class I SAM-dependent RNA methyltransferase n=1 Tax=Pseudaminobacter soli (ex Zhang et al. 2022) TaxID=2831468 RepID=A0A942DWA1_9HYPH|nr:RsmB/NOP family class I SAM-dependent RNA methyltransferase [Pseudaminobacter soli]MBS3648404.1 RsmB/NOP family class I SAM-dependent RNA methyltransferase [Pseudaminobacter soli]
MRLGGRLAAAIEVLEDIERRHRPAADALKDWGLSHRFAGAGDRAAIGNIVYDALRRRRSAGWLLGSDSPRALAFGALLLEWGETPEAINAELEGDRFAPPPLSDEEVTAATSRRLEEAPSEIRADVPDWCVPLFEASFDGDWAEEGRALAGRPPLDLRVNGLLSNRDRVLSEIRETGAQPTALAPEGIRIPPIRGNGRHPNVQAEPAFRKGWFEVQDEGSQLAADLAGARPGMQVLDFCAGAGGKTLALAADMGNRGQIFAYDAEKPRLAPIFDRIRRAGVRDIQVLSRLEQLSDLRERMDLVLVDAPCTGSGTWRRRPDAKWRLTQKQLDARKAEQAHILEAAKAFVKPGGRLVYITCSVFREENQDQISNFLENNQEFSPVDHGVLFEAAHPGQSDVARIQLDRGIVLTPLRTGTDGFYFASLQRAAG